MSIKNAILTCDKLTVYSPDYKVKIIKRGQEGIIIDKNPIKIFCISHEGVTFSYKVEIGDFKYVDGKQKNIDKIRNYVFDNKKYELYILLLAISVRNRDIILLKNLLYSKVIHSICVSEYYKSDTLPIPCGEYNFNDLIKEWYENEDIFEEEELLTKILQIVLFKCEFDNIDINKLFV